MWVALGKMAGGVSVLLTARTVTTLPLRPRPLRQYRQRTPISALLIQSCLARMGTMVSVFRVTIRLPPRRPSHRRKMAISARLLTMGMIMVMVLGQSMGVSGVPMGEHAGEHGEDWVLGMDFGG